MAASPTFDLTVATIGDSRPWLPFLLTQEGAVERGWANVGNLAVTGRSTAHDGRRHPTYCVEKLAGGGSQDIG
jgi:hypothetical protein